MSLLACLTQWPITCCKEQTQINIQQGWKVIWAWVIWQQEQIAFLTLTLTCVLQKNQHVQLHENGAENMRREAINLEL